VSRIAHVSGRLGAGKSSLAAPLAAELGYSLVTKDLIKETLHDALYVPGDGEIDEAWSLRFGAASFELLFALAARAGDMVIEANFHPRSELELGRLRGFGDRTVEVHCACPAEVAVARYNARTRHRRHPLPELADLRGRAHGLVRPRAADQRGHRRRQAPRPGVPNPGAGLKGVSAAQRAVAARCPGSVSAAVSVGYVTPGVVGMLGDPLDGSLVNEVR
jgi:predicted kinase